MLVLADICSALQSIEEGKTNSAVLILRSRLDRELLRISSNVAPDELTNVYAQNPDFAQVKAYRSKSGVLKTSATSNEVDLEVLKLLGAPRP